MRLSRSGLGLAVFAAAVAAALGPRVPHYLADIRGPSFPDALLALGSLIALGLAGWVLTIAALAMLGVSSRVLARFTPALLRGALLAGAAGVIAVGPAHAGELTGPETRLPHSVNGLRLPDRPEAQAPASSTMRDRTSQAVRVRPGDTLWAIAARSLPADATDAQIAAATRAWHHLNRAVIGADPNLIFPTQRLIPPTVKDLP